MTHPLAGKRIVITRPASQVDAFVQALRAVGGVPILFPTLQLVPTQDNGALDDALHRLAEFDWVVFTSANGVRHVMNRLAALGLPAQALNRPLVAVIGPSTANALAGCGVRVDLQPPRFVAESLFEALKSQGTLTGRRFLLLRAEVARPLLRDELAANGAAVEEIPVYRTLRGAPDPAAFAQIEVGADVITFTSPLTAAYFKELLADRAELVAQGALAASIGPITAQAVRQMALPFQDYIVAAEFTVPGLMTVLAGYFGEPGPIRT
ncbi:MAG TPA: uroporphyrinogen-III synthase [Aggregatilineales bacterium]|nr:uroporphyrinogen-III synthase [Aggregatilineales bacterium]